LPPPRFPLPPRRIGDDGTPDVAAADIDNALGTGAADDDDDDDNDDDDDDDDDVDVEDVAAVAVALLGDENAASINVPCFALGSGAAPLPRRNSVTYALSAMQLPNPLL
jgi:hypothetical protein